MNQKNAQFKDLVFFAHSGEQIDLQATEDALVLVMSGEPILEQVVQSGPFVMNTEEEIEQANIDFYSGKFGKL